MRPLTSYAAQLCCRFRITWMLYALLVVLHVPARAQDSLYTIQGVVADEQFEEPLQLVTLQVDSLGTGALTNLDGFFTLRLPAGRWTCRLQLIGYLDAVYTLEVPPSVQEPLVLYMRPKHSLNVQELEVSGRDSPANRIIKNASRNRDRNRLAALNAWECETYNKTTLTLNNISGQKLQKSLLLRPAREYLLANKEDSAMIDSNQRYKVGVFVTETVSRVYHKKGALSKEEVLGSRGSGFESAETGMVTALLAQVDFYDSYVTILERQFISPLAPGAFMNYNFYWLDTLVEAGQDTIFGIKVVPKRAIDPVFKGWIYIQGGSWAIRNLDLRMNADPNINFIQDIRIQQSFERIDNNWVPTLKDIQVDFKNTDKKMGFLGRSITLHRKYLLNAPRPDEFYAGETKLLADNAAYRDSTFWDANRQSPLEQSDSLAFGLVNHLQALPFWKVVRIAHEFFETGKKRFGKFDFGPYSKLVGYNQVEGLRTQLGVYSNYHLSERLSFGARVAYGWKDERTKYGGELMYRFNRIPDIRAGFSYYNDIEQVGIANYELDGAGLLNSLLMYRPLTQLNYYRDAKLWFQADIFPGGNGYFLARHKYFEPAFPFVFSGADGRLHSSYSVSELGTTLRFSFKEDYVIKKTGKVYTGTRYPIVYLEYGAGLAGLLDADVDYHRLKLTVTDKLKMGRLGWMNWTASVGQIFGEVPFPSLYVFQGSQSLAMYVLGGQLDALRSFLGVTNRTNYYQSVSFNLMHFYEFVADQYAVAGADWHLEGWFFKKLPGLNWVLNKLKWKEVLTLRMAAGSLTPENVALNNPVLQDDNREFIRIKAPDREPYVEYGVAVENIFKLFRVDYVRRFNYLNPQVPSTLQGFNFNWGLRVSMNFSF
ncbi:MAG: carboxypeptidase-like regulatory domain-containing protein [Bacteroidetes bacterium]|nr:carboxypeptidase-like regulatory domain-containing protein [Bacteroidota bacterium]